MVLVEGAAGVGKTSLLQYAATVAGGADVRVLQSRGAQLESEFGFGVVRQLFEPLFGEREPDQELGRLFGPTDASQSRSDPVASSSFEILHRLYWWTVRLADEAPLLLIVDDAQWADTASLRFLGFLARRLDGVPAAVVVASRPAELVEHRQLLADLRTLPGTLRLQPATLSSAAVRQLVASDLRADPSDRFVAACWETTGGNPLFLRELTRLLAARGVAPDDAAVPLVRAVGPAALSAHVESLFTREPPDVRRLADAAAVLAPQAPLPVVAEVAGLGEEQAEAIANRLVRGALLVWDEGLSYSHPLLQTAVYDSLPPPDRSRAHERAIAALTETGAPPERLAAHLLHLPPAGDSRRVSVLLAAAGEARNRCAVDSAAAYLRRAALEPPPDALRSEILRQLGNSEAYGLRFDAARRHLQEAVQAADTPEQRALAGYSLGRLLEACGRPVDAAAELRRAVAEFDDSTITPLRVRIEAELAGYARVVVAEREALQGYLRALASRPAETWPPLPSVLRAHHACELVQLGRRESEAAIAAEEALRGDRLAPDLSALWIAVFALLAAGRYATVRGYLRQAVDKATDRGLLAAVSLCRANLAQTALWQGDLPEVRVQLDLCRATVGVDDHATPLLMACEAELELELGHIAAAEAAVGRAVPDPQVLQSTLAFGLVFAHGRVQLAGGQARRALESFRQLQSMYEEWGASRLLDRSWRSGQSRALALLGDRTTARELAEDDLALAQESGAPRALGAALRNLAGLNEPTPRRPC